MVLRTGVCVFYALMAPKNNLSTPKFRARRREWDLALAAEMKREPLGPTQFFVGNFNVALRDVDIGGKPEYWLRQTPDTIRDLGDAGLDIGDDGHPATTANARLQFQTSLEEADMVDTSRTTRTTINHRNYTWTGSATAESNRSLVLDYAIAPSSIVRSGGVETSTILKSFKGKKAFFGSSHRPIWFSLKKDWQEREENWRERDDMNLVGEGPLLSDKDFFNPKEKRELELRGLWDEEELKSQQDLATTFRNQRHQVTPKSRRTRQDDKKVLMEMHGVRLEREQKV